MGGGQLSVFPVIGEPAVQIGGSASIIDMWESLNEGERGMNWPGKDWTRWGGFHGGGDLIWGKSQIRVL
jgi:hypothetical protein